MATREDVIVWFRRDLRAADHAALAAALREARRVFAVFVFDTDILDRIDDRHDRRLSFIHAALAELDRDLAALGGMRPGTPTLHVLHGSAQRLLPQFASAVGASAVYANRDYEPAAKERDAEVMRQLALDGRRLVSFKDQVLFESDEVLTAAGRAYTVFTPYRRAWEKRLHERQQEDAREHAVRAGPGQLQAVGPAAGGRVGAASARRERWIPDRFSAPAVGLAGLGRYGFAPADLSVSGVKLGRTGALRSLVEFIERITAYAESRDRPSIPGTSGLSPHLRFGTLSPREAVRAALGSPKSPGADAWLAELIWREFFFAILDRFPGAAAHNFKPLFDRVRWRDPQDDASADFAAWCAGRTGYPLVDAGLRELLATGRMHNRVRMVVASFLCKHLGIPWQYGERFFARHLLDYDLAANAGNWQWAASTGCDAQPWFRIFNPVAQSTRFDPQGDYIRRHVSELAGLGPADIHQPWVLPPHRRADYPAPIVDHAQARRAALDRFAILREAPA